MNSKSLKIMRKISLFISFLLCNNKKYDYHLKNYHQLLITCVNICNDSKKKLIEVSFQNFFSLFLCSPANMLLIQNKQKNFSCEQRMSQLSSSIFSCFLMNHSLNTSAGILIWRPIFYPIFLSRPLSLFVFVYVPLKEMVIDTG